MKRHLEEVHCDKENDFIATCVDATNCIYLVNRTKRGRQDPIHVVKKTFGENMDVRCELEDCEDARSYAINVLKTPAWECEHLSATANAAPYEAERTVSPKALQSLVDEKILSIESMEKLIEIEGTITCPLVMPMKTKRHVSERYLFFSAYNPLGVTWWAKLARCVTKFDTSTGQLSCACPLKSCLHRKITLWYLKTFAPSVLLESFTIDEYEAFGSREQLRYPPTGDLLVAMVQYIHVEKRIPKDFKVLESKEEDLPHVFVPVEKHCAQCDDHPALSEPKLVTRKGMILTQNAMVNGKLRIEISVSMRKKINVANYGKMNHDFKMKTHVGIYTPGQKLWPFFSNIKIYILNLRDFYGI